MQANRWTRSATGRKAEGQPRDLFDRGSQTVGRELAAGPLAAASGCELAASRQPPAAGHAPRGARNPQAPGHPPIAKASYARG